MTSGVDVLHLVVPGEPVPKARARTFWDARIRKTISTTPKRTAAAQDRIQQHLEVRYPHLTPFADGHFGLALNFYLHRTGRGDIDNYAKLVMDALQARVWANDSHVREIYARLHDFSREPRTEIEVSVL